MLRFYMFFSIFTVLLAAGCGGDGRSRVSGLVNLKGQPLKAGVISFIEVGAIAPSGGSAIQDGKYEVPAEAGLKPGKYAVAISAPENKSRAAAEEAMPGMSGPPPKETLPAKYNSKTELRAEVKAGAKNEFDFDLQ
ncbi:MAG: hypothetical protein ACKO9Z_13165 [Planctomycetota bacterium]